MRITIEIPQSVNIAVIESALSNLGARIVRRATKAKFDDLPAPIVVRGKDGSAREIDGLDILKRIASLDRECKARYRDDGRHANMFPNWTPKMSAEQYIQAFSFSCRHVKG